MNLDWDDVEPAAKVAFRIWASGSDFEWAKDVWQGLTAQGFTKYVDERERHSVIGRFLVFASIYRDWCLLMHDERYDDELSSWASELRLSEIHLGQFASDVALSDDPDEAISEALTALVRTQRGLVVRALRDCYGGSEAGLFVGFLQSYKGFLDPEPGDEDYVEPDYNDMLNDPTFENTATYRWIEEGCPNLR